MQEQRQDLYLNLIDQLVGCPNGKEPEILEAHPELIDADFVQTLVQVSASLAHDGKYQDTAKFLIFIARQLAKDLGLYPQASTTAPNS